MTNQVLDMVIRVQNIDVQIVRKDIKNLHLGVYPPDGYVRVAVPEHLNDENVRLAIVSKLAWIKKQQQAFQAQARQSKRSYISGECHYIFGQRYRLELIERYGKHEIKRLKSGKLNMFVRPMTSIEAKEKLLHAWYREELKTMIPELLEKWQPIVGKYVDDWGIKKMKTKWGSCNAESARIWLNLELAKKPFECLEYILVHELIHLHERHHNEHFYTLLEKLLPHWRLSQNILSKYPLVHDEW